MTILITGGMGFVGSYVARALLRDGADVVTVDIALQNNQASLVLEKGELAEVATLEGDISDPALCFRVIRMHGVEQIVHLVHASDPTGMNPAFEVQTNIQAFINVLEAARTFALPRVVWASSSAVFGSPARHSGPVGRDAPHWPRIPYEAYKSHNEILAAHYERSFRVNSIALRFNHVYGFGRRTAPDRPGLDRGLFIDPAHGRVGHVPCADGIGLWQHVEDTAGTVVAALHAPHDVQGAFNTCGSVASVREIASLVGERIPTARFEFLPGDLDYVYDVDDSETQAKLGYRRRFDMEDGVDATLRALRSATETDVIA